MNFIVFGLACWCFFHTVIALWGLLIIKNNCQTPSLFTRLRTLLIISSSFGTIFTANCICNKVCYEDDTRMNLWIGIFTFACSLTMIILMTLIRNQIDDCAENTDAFKLILLLAIILSVMFMIFGIAMIYNWWKKLRENNIISALESEKRYLAIQEEDYQKSLEKKKEINRLQKEAERKAAEVIKLDKEQTRIRLETDKIIKDRQREEKKAKEDIYALEIAAKREEKLQEEKYKIEVQKRNEQLNLENILDKKRQKEYEEELDKQNINRITEMERSKEDAKRAAEYLERYNKRYDSSDIPRIFEYAKKVKPEVLEKFGNLKPLFEKAPEIFKTERKNTGQNTGQNTGTRNRQNTGTRNIRHTGRRGLPADALTDSGSEFEESPNSPKFRGKSLEKSLENIQLSPRVKNIPRHVIRPTGDFKVPWEQEIISSPPSEERGKKFSSPPSEERRRKLQEELERQSKLDIMQNEAEQKSAHKEAPRPFLRNFAAAKRAKAEEEQRLTTIPASEISTPIPIRKINPTASENLRRTRIMDNMFAIEE